jgi:hypothetical protein
LYQVTLTLFLNRWQRYNIMKNNNHTGSKIVGYAIVLLPLILLWVVALWHYLTMGYY